MTSVASLYDFPVDYMDYIKTMNVVPTIATTSIAAYRDMSNVPKSLVLGATSNIELQMTDTLGFTRVDGSNDYRRFLEVYLDSNLVTNIEPDVRELKINDLYISSENNRLYLSTADMKSEGLFVKDVTTFEQSVLVHNNMVALGHVSGNTVNVWSKNGGFHDSNVSEVGFGFHVSSNHQLELVKYAKFADSNTVMNRVAIFGSKATVPGTSDTNYLVFDELAGVHTAGLSNANGDAVFSVCNLTLNGVTTLHGALIPNDADAYDLGSFSNSWKTVYTEAIAPASSNEYLQVRSSLVPDKPYAYDLGSAQYPFRDLYISSNTIYFGNVRMTTEGNQLKVENMNIYEPSEFGVDMLTASNAAFSNVMLSPDGIVTWEGDAGTYVSHPAVATVAITTNGIQRLRVAPNGYVGLGTGSNPTYPLTVSSANAQNVSIFASGDIASFSDARKKTNLAVIENALDKIDAITGYTYDPIEGGARSAGVLAQEVMQVLPEVVKQDEDGYYNVSYGNMISLLVQCVKELKSRFD